MLLFSFPAIIMNIGADIAAMGAVGNLLFPQINATYFSVVVTFILIFSIIYFPYQKIASILKYLCLTLLVYLIVPFLEKQDWNEIIKSTLIPTIQFDKKFLSIIVAILGTTISPYLFYWQATMEVEEVKHRKKHIIVNKKIIREMKKDVDFGMALSGVVVWFIILTTGTVLFRAGIHEITTVEEAAKALRPLAGDLAYILFAIGILGTGLLAIPVLSGALYYIFCETFGWQEGLDKKFQEAKPFYLIISLSLLLGLSLNYIGITPIQALIYSAILYGITAPVIIAIILHICNNKKIMGENTNGKMSNFLGFTTLILMTICAIGLIYLQFK
jgi:Mn2+/Fe2+ NRAMP family transporter